MILRKINRSGPSAPARSVAAALPIQAARFVVVEDRGHLSTLERLETVTAVMRYRLQI